MADAVEIPQHFFRALCQTDGCKEADGRRTVLGGFHMLSTGTVVFACSRCNRTSVFRNEAFGIRAASAGPLVEPVQANQRRRG